MFLPLLLRHALAFVHGAVDSGKLGPIFKAVRARQMFEECAELQSLVLGKFCVGSSHCLAQTRNFPLPMICSPSNQMSKSRPTQSMCVVDSHVWPVCSA